MVLKRFRGKVEKINSFCFDLAFKSGHEKPTEFSNKGSDAAKENTGEVHIFVPADVASYLLNEKRREIITIENSNKINILVIADPYKSRPYYKVVRVKSSDVKNNLSYKTQK